MSRHLLGRRQRFYLWAMLISFSLLLGACGEEDTEGGTSQTTAADGGNNIGNDGISVDTPDSSDTSSEVINGGCSAANSCPSGVCDPITGDCLAPTCTDGVQNDIETGVDCGGGDCPLCGLGEGCESPFDCASDRCSGDPKVCVGVGCNDGILNGSETGTDCGGDCEPCLLGESCNTGDDCANGSCVNTVCQEASCDDGVENGEETDTDCGGPDPDCSTCASGSTCGDDSDCIENLCSPRTGSCIPASCADGVRNFNETAVDCGGEDCLPCGNRLRCAENSDCFSNVCDPDQRTCIAGSCRDDLLDINETDSDCGGPDCLRCSDNLTCLINDDCNSGTCNSGSCLAAICGDGRVGGSEFCDDAGPSATCNEDCTGSYCGDQYVNLLANEACDSGSSNADNIPDRCRTDCQLPSCGDGVKDTGEVCDDNNQGDGDGCKGDCSDVELGFECLGNILSTCSSVCGDGIIATDELCDDGNTGGGDGCSLFCLIEAGYNCTGTPSNCQSGCGNGSIDGNEECEGSSLPTATCNVDCTFASCGDGLLNTAAGEQCDNGAANSNIVPGACRTDCSSPACGDGARDSVELCDDGNNISNDGCAAGCGAVEHGYICTGISPDICISICGDGIIAANEACDDGNSVTGDGCNSICSAFDPGYSCSGEPSVCSGSCGDGLVVGSEVCDDGNNINGDGCTSCLFDPGWTCLNSPGSSSVCMAAECGDGIIAGAEACDDENSALLDGCSPSCTLEPGWSCSGIPSTCMAAECGDGIAVGSEECDNGGANSNSAPNACRTDCRDAHCGDGVSDSGEGCDDGNLDNSDSCTDFCAIAICTDGIANGSESDIDCGGGSCSACPNGSACGTLNSNCAEGVCSGGFCSTCGAPIDIRDGSEMTGKDLFYQYSPTTPGAGFIYLNWDSNPQANSYEIKIGTTPGDDDIKTWTDVGNTTSTKIDNLTLSGAWDDVVYYATVRALQGSASCGQATSNGIRIAEALNWDGDASDLRTPDDKGGYRIDWPEDDVDSIYGAHYFETISISDGTEVLVQSWGKEDNVSANVAPDAFALTVPKDGWVSFYANTITIDGSISASGRGYGGGGGGGGTCGSAAARGRGGVSGKGGDGGPGTASLGNCSSKGGGGGGGGSPGGLGGESSPIGGKGGNGNLLGAGAGGSGEWGEDSNKQATGGNGGVTGCCDSRSQGAAGSNGNIGLSGLSKKKDSLAHGGEGEFDSGGGGGASTGNNNKKSGGGGGGGSVGAGGGGASESPAGGGGGGGTGGFGGADGPDGLGGAGPYPGVGATLTTTGKEIGAAGGNGGYRGDGVNGDGSLNRNLFLGSGGGGGGADLKTAGGGGGAGGGYIKLTAVEQLTIGSTGRVLANGAPGGGGGGDDNKDDRIGGVGGNGSGGGLLLEAPQITINANMNDFSVSARGGNGSGVGGTIKLFYNSFSGTKPSNTHAGRVYDAGNDSYIEP